MDHDNQPNRRWTDAAEEYGTSKDGQSEREHEVMSAYDEIDGRPMFIIAAVDSDRAWIAISDDAEVDPTDWC